MFEQQVYKSYYWKIDFNNRLAYIGFSFPFEIFKQKNITLNFIQVQLIIALS